MLLRQWTGFASCRFVRCSFDSPFIHLPSTSILTVLLSQCGPFQKFVTLTTDTRNHISVVRFFRYPSQISSIPFPWMVDSLPFSISIMITSDAWERLKARQRSKGAECMKSEERVKSHFFFERQTGGRCFIISNVCAVHRTRNCLLFASFALTMIGKW